MIWCKAIHRVTWTVAMSLLIQVRFLVSPRKPRISLKMVINNNNLLLHPRLPLVPIPVPIRLSKLCQLLNQQQVKLARNRLNNQQYKLNNLILHNHLLTSKPLMPIMNNSFKHSEICKKFKKVQQKRRRKSETWRNWMKQVRKSRNRQKMKSNKQRQKKNNSGWPRKI